MAKLLLIDDDLVFRSLVTVTLKEAGHVVIEARDGKEGIAKFRADPADLVIADLVMPGMEGIETIIALRLDFPRVKIIAMSGFAAYLQLARRFGAESAVGKPFKAKELLDAIDTVLRET